MHMVANHSEKIRKIYLAKECEKPIFKSIARLNLKIERVDNKRAQAMARGGNHQGFLAEVDEFELSDINSLKDKNFLVVLYGLSDVGNIGAIVRTAYALGTDGIIVIGKSLAMEAILRSSSGAAYEIPISLAGDGLSLINELKQVGFRIYAAQGGVNDHRKVEFSKKSVLVMGSEGEGIPNRAIQKCDELVSIKMREGWDSLNVSAAFAILCDRMING